MDREEEKLRVLLSGREAEIPPLTFFKLLDFFDGNFGEILKSSQNDFLKIGLSPVQSKKLSDVLKNQSSVEETESICRREAIKILTFDAPLFPPLLREIPDRPYLLFYKGRLSRGVNLSVVGTRNITDYGKNVLPMLISRLIALKVNIVSGLAYGVDCLAHRTALMGHGYTLAVLGSGIKNIYPKENAGLAERIVASGGALLSEYPLFAEPKSFHFPERNRIVAGLSKGVLVVEAAHKSGAKITARLALEYGREVMAVPGDINRAQSQGANDLLQNGATPVVSDADIAEALGLVLKPEEVLENNLSRLEQNLYNVLSQEPLSVDKIIFLAKLTLAEVLTGLSGLELKKVVKRGADGRYYKL